MPSVQCLPGCIPAEPALGLGRRAVGPAWDLAEQREASISFFPLKLQRERGINQRVSVPRRYLGTCFRQIKANWS